MLDIWGDYQVIVRVMPVTYGQVLLVVLVLLLQWVGS